MKISLGTMPRIKGDIIETYFINQSVRYESFGYSKKGLEKEYMQAYCVKLPVGNGSTVSKVAKKVDAVYNY